MSSPTRRDPRYFAVMVLATVILASTLVPAARRDVTSVCELRAEKSHLVCGEPNQVENGAVPPSMTPFFFLPVPINEADRQLLETLPGIGPGLAERIIARREAEGPIADLAELNKIPGIGPKRSAALADRITFQPSND